MTVSTLAEEDALLAQLGSGALMEGDIAAIVDRYMTYLQPALRKARWAYKRYLGNIGQPDTYRDSFLADHERAWERHVRAIHRAAHAPLPPPPADLRMGKIISGWHRSTYPLALSGLDHKDILICAARDVPWMQRTITRGTLCNIFDSATPMRLLRHFRKGGSIVAMLDYGYPSTANTEASFLGEAAHFPIGLLKLGRKFHYDAVLVDLKDARIDPFDTVPLGQMPEQQAIRHIASSFEKLIAVAPANWLLWASMDRCWLREAY